MVWDATNKCPLDCKFCFANRFGAGAANELGTMQAKALIKRLALQGARVFVFSGGDPLCRKDLPVLLKFAKQRGLKTIVHTTGIAPLQELEKILPFVDRVNLPLDGTARVHAAVRGSARHFDCVLASLRFLQGKKIPASVTTMVSRKNAKSVLGIARILQKFECVVLWRLLEFKAMHRALAHEKEFSLVTGEFANVEREVKRFAEKTGWRAKLQFVPAGENEFEKGFVLVSSSGAVS